MVFIPKHDNANDVEHYMPISMSNYKFKVISKIFAYRLASILTNFNFEFQKTLFMVGLLGITYVWILKLLTWSTRNPMVVN